ncbi:hypothetical protein BDN70DRAFT_990593 [Pholiota conissans]|uniref:F-box domain-containing protein n=1 Tax=Pholiota conissans TaxID=109636 RepID=A0A9P5ZA93_9AGAR|nr:hypothetical protein BDN70DRAFT_990593 [Pholiota conissans]
MNLHCQYCQCPRSTENEYICQPTDADACVACQRVAELDAKLERMREAIADLERERRRWKVQVNANHDKLTWRVPPEIVASILKFSLPENVTTLNLQYVTSMSTLGAPLVLSAVSRRWRDIAHSTPQLWTDVPLHLVESNYHSLPTLATDWMNKSGQCPLSINICVPKNETEQALDLIRVVNQFSSQWIHLQYDAPVVIAKDDFL